MTEFAKFLAVIQREVLNPLVFLFFALAAVYFLWGVVMFIRDYDNEAERKQYQRHIIWGIIGIAIMMSAFGIINLIADTVGVNVSLDP